MNNSMLTFVAKQLYDEKDLTYYTGLIDEYKRNKDAYINSHKYDEKEEKKLLKVEDAKIKKNTYLLGEASLCLNKIHKMSSEIIKLYNVNINNSQTIYNISNILKVINDSDLNNLFEKEKSKIENILIKLKNNLNVYIQKNSNKVMYSKYFNECDDKYVYLNDYEKYGYKFDDVFNVMLELYSKNIEEFSLDDVQVLSDYDEMVRYSYTIMDEIDKVNKEYELSRNNNRKEILERILKMYKDISMHNLKIKYLDLLLKYFNDSKYFRGTIKRINSIKNNLLKEFNDKKNNILELYDEDYS